MQTIVKRIAIFLFACMFFAVSVCATTVANVEPRFAYINAIYSNLTIDNDGTASCDASISVNGPNYTINVTCKLQRITQNGIETVATWYRSGNGILNVHVSKSIESGYQYRFYISGEIIGSTGSVLETFSKSCYRYY